MKFKAFVLLFLIALASSTVAVAADPEPTAMTNKQAIDLVQTHANYLWTLVAAALVFFMQAGFALVETGFTRAKNAINIIMKNLMDFSIGSIALWAVGFGLMFIVLGSPASGYWIPSGISISGRDTSRQRKDRGSMQKINTDRYPILACGPTGIRRLAGGLRS